VVKAKALSADSHENHPDEIHFSGAPMRRVRHPGFGAQLGVNSDPTGGSVYDAALCLCWWLESESGRAMVPLVGRAVVELGAGTGIVGLAAGRLGAHRVWMTDGTSLLLCCSAALLLCCSAALLCVALLLCCFALRCCSALLSARCCGWLRQAFFSAFLPLLTPPT
jgi:hypothetical protein